MKGAPGFQVDLEGEGVELGGWAALDGIMEDQKARTHQAQLDHASMYRQVFSTPNGRAVLKDLMEMFLRQRVARPGDDQISVGIRQGQADVVARILGMIEFANTGGGRPTGQPNPTEG